MNGLGWRPSLEFEAGLEHTVDWYLDNEDWPARAGLSHKGPLIEIWSLEKP